MARTEVPERTPAARLRAWRHRVRGSRTGRLAWRAVVTTLGVGIVVLGIVLLPLPGPGWLIIFAGLGLLATEYEWAARLLRYARKRVGEWTAWAGRQGRPVQALIGLAGLVVVGGALALSWLVYAG